MRNLKKFLALVLAMMMTLSLMVTVNASSFKDDDSITDEYSEAVDVLTELGIINGYSDGTFLPKEKITRAEVAAIIYRITTGDVEGKNAYRYENSGYFTDVTDGKWYNGYVNYCANNGLVLGVGNDRFEPSSYVTGYQALVMILRAMGYNNPTEFSSSDWKYKASGYGTRLGILKNIVAGSLGGEATREMVAEIMFQAIQKPTVKYTILNDYQPNVLVPAGTTNGANPGVVAYPETVYSTLMYEVFGIVGKHDTMYRDDFGRPEYVWVQDLETDTVLSGTKYVPNSKSPLAHGDVGDLDSVTDADTWATYKDSDIIDDEDDEHRSYLLAMNPVAVYDNAIDECTLTKEINKDKSIEWTLIGEWLNGKPVDGFCVDAADTTGTGTRTGYLDATHTTTKYIGQTGRTTEIYNHKADEDGKTWSFVYIDTFLAQVTNVTKPILDTNGHVIKGAKATVKVGNGNGAATLTLPVDAVSDYEKGDYVLLQTAAGDVAKLDFVEAPEKAPLTPADVPDTTAEFTVDKSVLVGKATKVENITITATRGAQDDKMGFIGSDGKTYYASDTFLAARGGNKTVLTAYYDGVDADKGITNKMIGRTYNLMLDDNGYVIGMDEVLKVESPIGVITEYEATRVSANKYVVTVEAFMVDGTTKSFQVIKTTALDADAGAAFFDSISAVDDIFAKGNEYADIGVGSLVEFGQVNLEGNTYWYIAEHDDTADTRFPGKDAIGAMGRVDDDATVETGVSETLATDTPDNVRLNDNTTIIVAESEFRYNEGDKNEGGNLKTTYKIYEGFKTIPTIGGLDLGANGAVGGTGNDADTKNVLYQVLSSNVVLVYPMDVAKEYTLTAQKHITVDDSYLVLSRGATYADRSEYNVLKNGVPDVLTVANVNDNVNKVIEDAMAAHDLIMVTGRNMKGQVSSAATVTAVAANATSPNKALAVANCGTNLTAKGGDPTPVIAAASKKSVSYAAGVMTVNYDTDANDTYSYLTVDDNVKVMIVNIDRGTTYESNMTEAMQYAAGFTADSGTTLDPSDLVFELNDLGYICTLYVID